MHWPMNPNLERRGTERHQQFAPRRYRYISEEWIMIER